MPPDPVCSTHSPDLVATTETQNLALIENLLKENAKLKERLQTVHGPFQERDADTKWLVAHRVFCHLAEESGSFATYLDTPVWVLDQASNHQHLDARRRIPKEDRWEERQGDVPFIAYLEYHCMDHPDNQQRFASRGRAEKSQLTAHGLEAIFHRREELFIRAIHLTHERTVKCVDDAMNQAMIDDHDK